MQVCGCLRLMTDGSFKVSFRTGYEIKGKLFSEYNASHKHILSTEVGFENRKIADHKTTS